MMAGSGTLMAVTRMDTLGALTRAPLVTINVKTKGSVELGNSKAAGSERVGIVKPEPRTVGSVKQGTLETRTQDHTYVSP